MSLELLPNEILFDIFNYFNGVDLLRTFYGLNIRFNFLLHERFLNCSFKFNSVSKRDFDTICQQHLPQMADYIINLHLSNNEETPIEIELFLSSMPSFHQFTQLQSISLFDLRSYETLMKILEECHHLYNLTHLNLFYCLFQNNQVDFQLIINHIWCLPKLIHCTIGIAIKGQHLFCIPTKISLSLEYLSIERLQIKLDQIDRLLEYTPNLKSLSISVQSFIDNNYIPSPLPMLIDLNINSLFTCNASNMSNLLQNIPNLRRLNVDLSSELVDGNQWEEIIRNNLPQLEIFKLKMKMTCSLGQNIQLRIDNLINSFRSSFWIDEHKWFVRCLTWERTIYLHTLPNNYEENLPVTYQSTCSDDDQQDFYNNITNIIYSTSLNQTIPSYIRLSKLHHLCIHLPIDEQFWTIIPNLNRLISLKILFHMNSFQSQVQALLNRASHLKKLSINQHQSIPLQTSLFKYTNISVYELNLRDINHYFNEQDCILLSRSSLGIQCEKLSILIYNRECILSLVKNMFKLRSLNVRCKDDDYIELTTLVEDNYIEYYNTDKDNYIQWLKNHLPPASIVVRDPKSTCNILIWI